MILGFDPGKSGGASMLAEDGAITLMSTMPLIGREWDLLGLLDLVSNADLVVIEKVASGGRVQGPKANFTFGEGYGYLKMACAAKGKNCELVTPKKWQKEMLGVFAKGQSKPAALAAALRIWPTCSSLIRHHEKHDGVIDSLLIAEWGRRNLIAKK